MYEFHCPHCGEHVATVFSSEPLPGIYHPACAEEEAVEEANHFSG